MPTTNWELRKQSPHYLFYSLESFRMVQKLRKLRFLLLLLILDMVEEERSGSLTILFMALRMMSFQDNLRALRPYNFYPPEGFYPTGSHDPYWTRSARHEELFLKRFRFRLPDFHRLMRAMKMDGEYFTCDTGKKYPADLCMMVFLRRLSYPCTFRQLATEFGIPSHRLCEFFRRNFSLSHSAVGPPSHRWGRAAPRGRTMCAAACALRSREAIAGSAFAPPPAAAGEGQRTAAAPCTPPRASSDRARQARCAPLARRSRPPPSHHRWG